ncbi:EAL domain-containing protein [Bacillus sp. T3]|uniref:EAL domain-containing protein n=1 Tax=Bacillus sp. T3 TaxID=467262 RepID=UPI0029813B1D|nr:EAL domain-containing protein [Bacillus sp. T3]
MENEIRFTQYDFINEEDINRVYKELKIAIILINENGDQLFANTYFCSIFGYTSDELKAKRLVDLFEAEDLNKILAGTINEKNSDAAFHIRGKKHDNSPLYLKVLYHKIHEGIIRLQLLDVTEHVTWEINANSIFNGSSLAHITLDINGLVKNWNQVAEVLFGWNKEEVLNQPYPLIPNFNSVKFVKKLMNSTKRHSLTGIEVKRIRKDGTWLNCLVYTTPLYDHEGNCNGAMILIEDISHRKHHENQIKNTRKELEDFKYALDQAATVSITDVNGNIIYVNDKFCEISKFSRNELIGQNHRILKSNYHSVDLYKQLWDTIKSGNIWRGDLCNKAKDGSIWWGASTIVPLFDYHGRPYQFIGIRSDITDQKVMEKEIRENYHKLYETEYYDFSTKLPNIRQFEWRIIDEQERAKSKIDGKFSLFIVDLHGFRFVNDSFGTETGDRLLLEASIRLKKYTGTQGILFRLNGKEFAIIFPDLDKNIKKVTKELVQLFKQPFLINEFEHYLNCNIGVSVYPDSSTNIKHVIKHAFSALYQAREKGKDHYQIFSPNMDIETYKRFSLMKDLRKAVKNNEFFLVYQPRIDAKTDLIVGAEALVRWKHPKWGLVSPVEFITLAEEGGFIHSIGEIVLHEACRQNKCWQDQGFMPITVSVNFSVHQFMQPDMIQVVDRILKETGIDPKWVEIEITETAVMKDEKNVLAKISELKALGIRIAIDDFGTGYASLSYLKKVKANTVKIDRSFIRDIPTESDSTEIVSSIVQLAKRLKIITVAEGVELEEQLQFLQQMECEEVQGYLYSRPVLQNELEEFLVQKNCAPKPWNWIAGSIASVQKQNSEIALPCTILAKMSISEISGEKLSLGSTDVMITKIGINGLQVESTTKLSIQPDLVLQFNANILGVELELFGTVVWKRELDDDKYLYEVCLILDKQEKSEWCLLLENFPRD